MHAQTVTGANPHPTELGFSSTAANGPIPSPSEIRCARLPFLWLLDSGVAGTSTQLTPLANQGAWSAGTAYNANDVVLYNGSSYISQCPTTSTPFGTACRKPLTT
jgi:hypothetical protein